MNVADDLSENGYPGGKLFCKRVFPLDPFSENSHSIADKLWSQREAACPHTRARWVHRAVFRGKRKDPMTNMPLTIALAQVEGSAVPAENLAVAKELVAKAAAEKADLIVFPEMFMALPEKGRSLDKVAEPLEGPFVNSLAELASKHGLHIVSGFWESVPGDHRVHNTAVILSPEGKILDCYRKVHLFDALSIKESDRMIPGNALPPIFTIKGVRIGLAICYDLEVPGAVPKSCAPRG